MNTENIVNNLEAERNKLRSELSTYGHFVSARGNREMFMPESVPEGDMDKVNRLKNEYELVDRKYKSIGYLISFLDELSEELNRLRLEIERTGSPDLIMDRVSKLTYIKRLLTRDMENELSSIEKESRSGTGSASASPSQPESKSHTKEEQSSNSFESTVSGKKKIDLKELSNQYYSDLFQTKKKLVDLLNVMSHFVEKSPNNLVLIAAQYPTATVLKTYDEWHKLGEKIQQGKSGIKVWQKNENDKKKKFYIESLFDISQLQPSSESPTYTSDTITPRKLYDKVRYGTYAKRKALPPSDPKLCGELAYFDVNDNVIYCSQALLDEKDLNIIIPMVCRETILSTIASWCKEYKREKYIDTATCASYVLCKKAGLNPTSCLDFDGVIQRHAKDNQKLRYNFVQNVQTNVRAILSKEVKEKSKTEPEREAGE